MKKELLLHATWLDFEQRLQKSFTSVEYFVHKIFANFDIDRLNEEFINYQLLSPPSTIKESANLSEEDPHKVDMFWGYFRGVKKPGRSKLAFGLFSVAEVVMSIPHSNAVFFFHLLIKTRHLLEVRLNLKALYLPQNPYKQSTYLEII